MQHVNSSTPRHAAAAGKAEAQLAPPQAPATQFSRPLDALDSGAVAASARAAAQARVPSPADIGALEQREALSSAAAVAHEAAAEVLHADGGEEAGEEEGLAGQEGRLLQEEMRIEAAEAAAEPAEPVVVTSSGEIALAPEAPAKGAGALAHGRASRRGAKQCRGPGGGQPASSLAPQPPLVRLLTLLPTPRRAVPSRGATPLPPDPFDMTAEEGGLGPNTLSELKVGQSCTCWLHTPPCLTSAAALAHAPMPHVPPCLPPCPSRRPFTPSRRSWRRLTRRSASWRPRPTT